MIKKLKNNSIVYNKKDNSLLNFINNMNENIEIKRIPFNSYNPRQKYNGKQKSLINYSLVKFNRQSKITDNFQKIKISIEDRENLIYKNPNELSNLVNPLNSYEKTLQSYFKPNNINQNNPIYEQFKNIEFHDEMNKKKVKMLKYQEKDLEFTKSDIIPKMKFMKIDDDVKTDDEQIKISLNMMRNNLKECLKSIQEKKDYLSKNLSKKINFVVDF